MIGFSLDSRELTAAATRVFREQKKSAPEFLEQQARLFDVDAMKLTPPFTSARPITDQSWGSQKRAGENSLKRDVLRAFRPLFNFIKIERNQKNPEIARAIRSLVSNAKKSNFHAVKTIISDLGFRSIEKYQIVYNASQQLLEQQRSKQGKQFNVPKGRIPILVVNRASINGLIRRLLKDVGEAKAGWVNNVNIERVPAWIKRNSTQGGHRSGSDANGHWITMQDDVRYGKAFAGLDIASAALKIRELKLTAQYESSLARKLKNAWEGSGS